VPTVRKPTSRGDDARAREIEILRLLLVEQDPKRRQRLNGELIRVGEWEPQIKALAERWHQDGVLLDEFCQAGLMGLLEAASRFDEGELIDGKGWPTYAMRWIRRRIGELARRQGCIVAETEYEIKAAKTVAKAVRAGASSPEQIREHAKVKSKTKLTDEAIAHAMTGRRPPSWRSLSRVRLGEVA